MAVFYLDKDWVVSERSKLYVRETGGGVEGQAAIGQPLHMHLRAWNRER